jgi:GTP cyclohydrolase II
VEKSGPIPFLAFGHDLELTAFAVRVRNGCHEVIVLRTTRLDTDGGRIPLVRVHSACVTSEAFGSPLCDCALQLEYAVRLVSESHNGAIIYLPWQEGRGNGIVHKVKMIEHRLSSVLAGKPKLDDEEPDVDRREYAAATAVVRHLGISKIRLITNNPAKIEAFRSGGFEIERVPSTVVSTEPSLLRYREYCVTQLGHLE